MVLRELRPIEPPKMYTSVLVIVEHRDRSQVQPDSLSPHLGNALRKDGMALISVIGRPNSERSFAYITRHPEFRDYFPIAR